VVEGRALSARGDDRGDDRVQVRDDVARGKANGGNAESGECLVARTIAAEVVAALMYLAVDLDRESGAEAGEVERIFCDWIVSTKLEPAGTRPKCEPQALFRGIAAAAFAAR
jgi:hypothetical protein